MTSRSSLCAPGVATAVIGLVLLLTGMSCSIVSLTGMWWEGTIHSEAFSGLASASGRFTLWTFVADAKFLIFDLPDHSISVDSPYLCGREVLVSETQDRICHQIYTTRALVGAAVAFSSVGALAGLIALASLLGCGGLDTAMGQRLQLVPVAFSVLGAGLMVAALVTAALAGSDLDPMLGETRSTLGPAVYCAIFQIVCLLLAAAFGTSARSAFKRKTPPVEMQV
mmetsp:Transcript_14355/g.24928  ORF Transcript_14355/g.24928 Transcript_14355/m.24928 type:complete len:225 (+) Transcript_14355:55-729(+)